MEQAEQEKLILEQYERLRDTDIRVDIKDTQIDPALPVEERLVSVVRQMKGNPFVYRCGDILVKTSFTGTKPLQEILEDILDRNIYSYVLLSRQIPH